MTPGQRIRAGRIEANLTIRELASLSQLTPEGISIIENTDHLPSFKTLRKLANVLNRSIAYLGCFEYLPEKTFGERLRKARYYYGYTLEEAAHYLEVDAKSIKNWEIGANKPLKKFIAKIEGFMSIIEE